MHQPTVPLPALNQPFHGCPALQALLPKATLLLRAAGVWQLHLTALLPGWGGSQQISDESNWFIRQAYRSCKDSSIISLDRLLHNDV